MAGSLEIVVIETFEDDGGRYETLVDPIIVRIYVYDEGIDGELTMSEDSNIVITPERAKLCSRLLGPENFINQPVAPTFPETMPNTPKEAFTKYAFKDYNENSTTFHGCEIGENVMVTTYREEGGNIMRVMIRGYDEVQVCHTGTGVVTLESFRVDVERANLIISGLLEYFLKKIKAHLSDLN